jgi:hypothetical protein
MLPWPSLDCHRHSMLLVRGDNKVEALLSPAEGFQRSASGLQHDHPLPRQHRLSRRKIPASFRSRLPVGRRTDRRSPKR